jgi:hypothetical protein
VAAGLEPAPRWIQIVLDWHDAWRARPTNVAKVWSTLEAKHGLAVEELRATLFG